MTRVITLLLVLAASLLAADPTAAVSAAADGWHEAAVKQDKAALERLLADDLTYSHAGGTTQNKAEYIAAVTHGPAHYESFTESDVKITIYGTVAVLSGFTDVKMINRPSYRVRTQHVYVLNQGQWQLAAHLSTRVSPPAPSR
jgi:hypothetical protein